MGRIRTKDIKDLATDLAEAYPESLKGDFAANKEAINETKLLAGKSKRFRNRVTGYTVRLARRVRIHQGQPMEGESEAEPA
jgi:ribosomal protein S17E